MKAFLSIGAALSSACAEAVALMMDQDMCGRWEANQPSRQEVSTC